MTKLKASLVVQPLLRSLVPLTIGSTSYLLSKAFKSEITIFDQIHKNYFAFLLTTIILDTVIRIVQKAVSRKSSVVDLEQGDLSLKKEDVMKGLLSTILTYSVIFCVFQVIGIVFVSAGGSIAIGSPLMKNPQMMEFSSLPSRLLEEEEHLTKEKISLSLGNIVSTVNIDATGMVISSDRRHVFATVENYGTLKIVDISDLKNPSIVGSLALKQSGPIFQIKTLAVSSDEKTLYISNARDLEIVDIHDPSHPKLISFKESEIFIDMTSLDLAKNFQTSIAIDETTKTLFVGGLGFQVFDITDPKNPAILKAEKNLDSKGQPQRNELYLSQHNQRLYMANGNIEIYDVSNPKDLKLLSSFDGLDARSLAAVAGKPNCFFLLGPDPTESNKQIYLKEYDFTDYKSPILRAWYPLKYTSTYSPRILAISPGGTEFYIFLDEGYQGISLLVYDTARGVGFKNENSLIDNTYSMAFFPDGRTLVTGSNDQLMIIELITDYPNSQIFGSFGHQLTSWNLDSTYQKMHLSSDKKTFFTLRAESQNSFFEIWDLKDLKTPARLLSYKLDQVMNEMYFAKSYDQVFLLGEKNITVLDISKRSNAILEAHYKPNNYKEESGDLRFSQMLPMKDGKSGFVARRAASGPGMGEVSISILGFIGGAVYIDHYTFEKKCATFNCKMVLTEDEKTLFIIDQEINIYDVSNIDHPAPISSYPLGISEKAPYISSVVLSRDNARLYIETYDDNRFTNLRIYDVSKPTIPDLRKTVPYPKYDSQSRRPSFSLGADLRHGFFFQDNSLVKLDLSDFVPRVSGTYPLSLDKSEKINDYFMSDDITVFLVTDKNQIRVLDIDLKYTLYMKQDSLLLGAKFSGSLSMFGLDDATSDYSLMDKSSYKILKLSFLDIKVAPNKYSLEKTIHPLPLWMSFDKESNYLTLDPKETGDLGYYNFLAASSLKIPLNAFDNIGVTSEDLFPWLVSMGYIDNHRFLKEEVGSFEDFMLPAQYKEYRKQIYDILKQYYFETCTSFHVMPSLDVKDLYHLTVSTLATGLIEIDIKLMPHPQSKAHFINKPYGHLNPVISEGKTKLSFEGLPLDVNAALQEVVIDVEGKMNFDGIVNVNDGLNPHFMKIVDKISRNFILNEVPRLNAEFTIQEQVDKIEIYTGEHFKIQLREDSFVDKYSENLNYEIISAQDDEEIPGWLNFNNLALHGTPPDEVSGSNTDLVLIAKNEFKYVKVPFTLHVKVSKAAWIKFLMKYTPYALLWVGILFAAFKIFGGKEKSLNRHPKEYVICAGEGIDSGLIFPIFFIQQEKEEANFILKQLEKYVSKRQKTGEFVSKAVLVNYFLDSSLRELEKQRIVEAIQEIAAEDKGASLTVYSAKKTLIQQLVINQMTLWQLDQEHQTKSIFIGLKDQWIDLAYWDTMSSKLALDHGKFERIVQEKLAASPRKVHPSQEEPLLPTVNMELLHDAILAYACENHQIDRVPVDVKVRFSQEEVSNSLLDGFGGKKSRDFGITWSVDDGMLSFAGTADRDMGGKIVLMEILIGKESLKEICIHGSAYNQDVSVLGEGLQSLLGDKSEILLGAQKKNIVKDQRSESGYEAL